MDGITPVAAGIKAPDFDPLATLGKVQAVQGGMLQNRLLGLNLQGKQALGEIIGQNTDPTTGETNWQGVSGAASQNPQAAILLPEIQKQVLDRQLTNVQLQREQLGLTGDQWKVTGAAAMELLGRRDKDGNPAALSPDDVMSTLVQDANFRGLAGDQNFITRLASFAQSIQGKDPDQVRQALKGIALMANPTAETVGILNGAPSTVTNGSQTIGQQVSPLTGETTKNFVVNQGRTPSEKASLVQVWNPQTHQYEYKPSGSVIGDMAPGAIPGNTGSGAKPPTTVAAAPALGETATAESNVQQAQQLQQRAAMVPDRKAALANLVNTVDQFATGPASGQIGKLKALAAQFGIAPTSINASAAARDEFNKLASQVALQQFGALGGTGSNQQLDTSLHANPNEVMTNMGIKNVVALLQGNEDAIGAQFQAWKKFSAVHGDASYGDFLAGWNRYYDPRVFQAQHMDKASRDAMLRKMSPDERKTYNRDLSVAQQAGWLGQ